MKNPSPANEIANNGGERKRKPPLLFSESRRRRYRRQVLMGTTVLLFWFIAQWSIFWIAEVQIKALKDFASPLHPRRHSEFDGKNQKPYNNTHPKLSNDPQLIHIVHTRFMQHQGNLTKLGIARLKQFLTFCLPTMAQQTTQDFFWIVKVDPAMTLEENKESYRGIFEPLLRAINAVNHRTNHHNIYLVASNHNHNLQHGGSWRDGQEWEELMVSTEGSSTTSFNLAPNSTNIESILPAPGSARVFSGNTDRLKRVYELREVLPVLETRLDADDGLHKQYLERVQTMALERFLGIGPDPDMKSGNATPIPGENKTNDSAAAARVLPPTPKWLYWCVRTQVEWHSEYDPNSTIIREEQRNNSKRAVTHFGSPVLGYLGAIRRENYCITPGMTVGYGVGQMRVPRLPHDKLWDELHDKYKRCHSTEDRYRKKKGPCLEFMGGRGGETEEEKAGGPIVLHALRCRTLTSTGMFGVFYTTSNNTTSTASSSLSNNDDKPEISRMEAILWEVLVSDFGIDPKQVQETQRYLLEHRRDIAYQNSLGQCTPGHSCKHEAKKRLDAVVVQTDSENNRNG